MIVRILGEGQVDVPDAELDALNKLDDQLQSAAEGGDEVAFAAALSALLGRVRQVGKPLGDAELVPSDLVLPSADASLADVRELFNDVCLIPC